MTLQILELLWSLAHLPHISREMVELALDAHSSILIESYHTKDSERKTYISKCVEDIRKVRNLALDEIRHYSVCVCVCSADCGTMY